MAPKVLDMGPAAVRNTLALIAEDRLPYDNFAMTRNIIIKPETGHYNLTPFGFHKYGNEYFIAADLWTKNILKRGYSPVPYFLYCRSIELGLKAFLLAKKTDKKIVKKNSHNLIDSLNMAMTNDLDSYITTSEMEKKHISLANDIYSGKGFEYFFISNHVHGFENFPDLSILHDYADRLLKQTKALTSKINS